MPDLSNTGIIYDVSSGATAGTPYNPSSAAGSSGSMPGSTGRVDPFSDVTIDLREMHNIDAERWCSIVAAETEPRPFETPTFDPFLWENSGQVEGGSSGMAASSDPLDSQTGISWILE